MRFEKFTFILNQVFYHRVKVKEMILGYSLINIPFTSSTKSIHNLILTEKRNHLRGGDPGTSAIDGMLLVT